MNGASRVLVVVEQLRRAAPGGIGTTALGLLDGLRRVGPDASDRVALYASRPRHRPDPLGELGYPVVTVPVPGPVLTRAWDRGHLPAPRHASVVHAVSLAFPPPRRAALVVQVNDLLWRALPEAFPPRGRRWHEAALGRALASADRLVVPAPETAAELVAAGADPSVIRVVPYGCDHLAPPDRDAAIRTLARSGVHGPFLLGVGTLEPRKNLQRIIGAYRSIRDSLPAPWPLVLVGPQGWNEQIAAAEDVVLVGRVEPPVLTALYDMARLLVYVPLMEGYGLPPLEAMSRGTPVVASPLPSTGTAAYDVDPGDQDAIADALLTVSCDEQVRSSLSERGRSHSASLTWAATARSMMAIWDEAELGSRAAPGRSSGVTAGAAPEPVDPTEPAPARQPVVLSVDVSAVPANPVGAGRYTLELVSALANRPDVDLRLWARRDDRRRWRALAPSARVVGAAPSPRPARLAWEQVGLPLRLARAGIDVHHGPHYTMPEHTSVPVVVTIHDLSFFEAPQWHERSKVVLFRRAITVAARRAAVIVCPSQVTADELARWCRVDGEVLVAHHGVDADRFTPIEPVPGGDAALLGRLEPGLVAPDGSLYRFVVFVGTLEPRKDVPNLVRAFDRVASRHSDVRLVLAGGDGWGAEAVRAAVAAVSSGSRVLRIGYVPDAAVPALLRSAAVVAYPALYEGFGLPALEALACGAPLVTTSGTAMEEVAGSAAVLVPPADTLALADALDELLGTGEKGEKGMEGEKGRIGDMAARRRQGFEIAARHTWAASAERHLRAYRAAAR